MINYFNLSNQVADESQSIKNEVTYLIFIYRNDQFRGSDAGDYGGVFDTGFYISGIIF